MVESPRLKRVSVALVLGTAILVATDAFALHITTRHALLAWSKDGTSALLRENQDGPEGGGSIAYVIVGAIETYLLVSEDFSPGDGSRPQRIATKGCRAAATELARALAKAGFDGVEVDADQCSRARDRVVEVDAKVRDAAEKSFRDAAEKSLRKAGENRRMARSPTGKLFLEFEMDPYGVGEVLVKPPVKRTKK